MDRGDWLGVFWLAVAAVALAGLCVCGSLGWMLHHDVAGVFLGLGIWLIAFGTALAAVAFRAFLRGE